MVNLLIDVNNIIEVLKYYDQIKVYRADSETGAYAEITDSSTRIPIVVGTTKYRYDDTTGDSTKWYRTSYFNSGDSSESSQSDPPLQGGSKVSKVGWTFGNYSPPEGEWGDLYTPDDMRYTMLFGIDSTAADIAQSEWEDEQYRQLVREAIGDFESYLTMDIMRKSYKTNPLDSLVQSPVWREGVDYTHEEEPYDFDPTNWNNYGFVQLRHSPIISVSRAIWKSPVQGDIMDFIANNWIRVYKQFGQLRFFPKGGFSYGPYSVYGPLWSNSYAGRYPGGLEFDYETGFKSAAFVPEGLRGIIGKYATIKALAAIGDGLLAGFSSQSISLDGLSESFSSTQSATSAYFGARIKQYSDEITAWLKANRYKFSPPPISFVGT